MKCKQTLESERTYFYHAVFVSRFHQLPKLSSSQSLEVQNNSPAAAENKGEEMVADPGRAGGLLKPTPHRLGRVKSLREMPGPNTLYNLYEFFWKDGFGRIHEIQVPLTRLLSVLCTAGSLSPFPFSPATHRLITGLPAPPPLAAAPPARGGEGVAFEGPSPRPTSVSRSAGRF